MTDPRILMLLAKMLSLLEELPFGKENENGETEIGSKYESFYSQEFNEMRAIIRELKKESGIKES